MECNCNCHKNQVRPKHNGFEVLAGNSNLPLAREISSGIGIELGKALVTTYSDGESRVEIHENVRRKEVFIIQSLSYPVNDHFMELLCMIDACVRASSGEITVVIPYFGYGRQDRKNRPRVPITAEIVCRYLKETGAIRILSMDLHAGQIQGFFRGPVDNLYGYSVLLPYIQEHFNHGQPLVIVSPDAGGVPRARYYAKRLKARGLDAGLALIDKRRDEPNVAEAVDILGEVEGRTAIVLDDMIDTGGTLVEATRTLLEKKAKEVHAVATHAVLSGPAVERIENSEIKSVAFTDSIPLNEKAAACEKIKTVPAGHVFAEAIQRIYYGGSLSELFEV